MCSKCELQKTIDVDYLQEPELEEYFDEFVWLMKNYFDDQIDTYLDQIESLALQKTLDEQALLDYIAEIEKLLEKIAKVGQLKVTWQVKDELQSLAVLDFEVSLTIDDDIAKDYALNRWGELIKAINATTQKQMGELINKAMDEWRSKGYLAEQINTKFKQYNEIRSALIAHQEIALAYGNSKRLQFTQHAGEFQQVWRKRAQTQNDGQVRPEHYQNQEDWYIEADKAFSGTGDMNEPFWRNCRCTVSYRLFKPDDPAPFVWFTSLYQLNG